MSPRKSKDLELPPATSEELEQTEQGSQQDPPPVEETPPSQEELDAAEAAAAASSAHDDPVEGQDPESPPAPQDPDQPAAPEDATQPSPPAETEQPAPPPSADPLPDTAEVIAAKADERQPAEKQAGPAPIDQATLDVAVVKPTETLEGVAAVMPSKEKLTELDEVDSNRAAALRRQRDWENDSKKFFPGETREEKDRKELIAGMDALDSVERKRVEDEKAERAKQEEIDTRHARILELQGKLNAMSIEAQGYMREIERLQAYDEV